MNTDRDKRIAEALGLCWHNIYDRMSALTNADTGITKVSCDVCEQWVEPPNPNFSTFDGMGLILQLGPRALGGRKWTMFLLSQEACPHPIREKVCIPLWLLQDPDRLANELDTFIKEMK